MVQSDKCSVGQQSRALPDDDGRPGLKFHINEACFVAGGGGGGGKEKQLGRKGGESPGVGGGKEPFL